MSDFSFLLEDVRTIRDALQARVIAVHHTRLWRTRKTLTGAQHRSMAQFAHDVERIETLLNTLEWDHAFLMICQRLTPPFSLASPGTVEAIKGRVRVASDLTLWLQDYLVYAARWDRGEDDPSSMWRLP